MRVLANIILGITGMAIVNLFQHPHMSPGVVIGCGATAGILAAGARKIGGG